jgi:hypothetical protein
MVAFDIEFWLETGFYSIEQSQRIFFLALLAWINTLSHVTLSFI